jgi:hypothetical protein
MSRAFPARLHVVVAWRARRAVVFRRGPSTVVATLGWDLATDRFQLGQWLRGRIYERRADLSPDGRHLIYFAANHARTARADSLASWTAISRAPWLTALALYQGLGCWQGGGLFLSDTRFWLNGCNQPVRQHRTIRPDPAWRPSVYYGNECTGVYYPRLERDGWRRLDRLDLAGISHRVTRFEKDLGNGWILRKLAHEQIGAPPGRGCYWDEHELVRADPAATRRLPDWEWAERDRRSLLWAERGCLYRARLHARTGFGPPRVLYDLNDLKFERRVAPY